MAPNYSSNARPGEITDQGRSDGADFSAFLKEMNSLDNHQRATQKPEAQKDAIIPGFPVIGFFDSKALRTYEKNDCRISEDKANKFLEIQSNFGTFTQHGNERMWETESAIFSQRGHSFRYGAKAGVSIDIDQKGGRLERTVDLNGRMVRVVQETKDKFDDDDLKAFLADKESGLSVWTRDEGQAVFLFKDATGRAFILDGSTISALDKDGAKIAIGTQDAPAILRDLLQGKFTSEHFAVETRSGKIVVTAGGINSYSDRTGAVLTDDRGQMLLSFDALSGVVENDQIAFLLTGVELKFAGISIGLDGILTFSERDRRGLLIAEQEKVLKRSAEIITNVGTAIGVAATLMEKGDFASVPGVLTAPRSDLLAAVAEFQKLGLSPSALLFALARLDGTWSQAAQAMQAQILARSQGVSDPADLYRIGRHAPYTLSPVMA